MRQLPKLINHSLKLDQVCGGEGSELEVCEESVVEALSKNSNKFTASVLLALS